MKPTDKEKTYIMNGLGRLHPKMTVSEMKTFINMCFEGYEKNNVQHLTKKLKKIKNEIYS